MISRFRAVYDEYPQQFWLLIGAAFINMVGNALIFPFLALYITDRFDVGMTRVGTIFAIFAVANLFGSTIGGALADRFGRKPIFLFALVTSALGNLSLIIVPSFGYLYPIGFFLGIVGSMGDPPAQAMIADMLPEEKRAEGFGVIRIVFNVAVMFGPVLGGLLAQRSYALLFIADTTTSLVTAVLLAIFLRETRPEKTGEQQQEETLAQSFRGYGIVLRDVVFMSFVMIGVLVQLVYIQMNTTLAVFLRDEHGILPQGFGLLIGMNAAMVVLMQFWITRRIRKGGYPPLLVMAAGTFLYAVGFGMFGFVSATVLFVLAMVIITIGEMFIAPVGQAMAANFAREDMRGRYMAVFSFGFAIAAGLGTLLAGLVIDNLNPNWLWHFALALGSVAALGYVMLHRFAYKPDAEEDAESAVEPDVAPAAASAETPAR
ncbi:MAG: MFS transporter [Chloroflexi bacterium]|nr:MFS transporter [Chloroflexota bacterium]